MRPTHEGGLTSQNSKFCQLERVHMWDVGRRFHLVEPRVLGHGTYGPVLRARDVNTAQLVALRVYDASDAFQSQRLSGCASLAEAQEQTLAHFKLEVSTMHSLHRGRALPGVRSELRLDQLPHHSRESCSRAVTALLDFSCDADGNPARATDGCCYIVTEPGMFSLEQLARDSQEQLSRGRHPSIPEVRETLRSLLSLLETLHKSNCVLVSHSPR